MNGSSVLFLLVTFNILCNVLCSPTLTLRVEQSKIVVCEASCQLSVTCTPKLLVLNEHPNNITRIAGRTLTSFSEGVFVVLCYMKSSLINSGSPTVWTVKSYKSSTIQYLQFSMHAVTGGNLKIMELVNWETKVEQHPRMSVDCGFTDDGIRSIRLTCSDNYEVNSLGKLQILNNKLPNGSSTDHYTVFPFDPKYLTATYHNNYRELNFQYKQEVTYTDDLQNSSYECYSINVLSGMEAISSSENVPRGCGKKSYFSNEDDIVFTYTPELENLVGKSIGKRHYAPAMRLSQYGECSFQIETGHSDMWSLTVNKTTRNHTFSQSIVLPQELSGLVVYVLLGATDLTTDNENFRIRLIAFNVTENRIRINRSISLPVKLSLQIKMRMINGQFFTSQKHKFTIRKLDRAQPDNFTASYKQMRRDKLPETILKFSK